MPASLSDLARLAANKKRAETSAPPPVAKPRDTRLERVTVLLYPETLQEADQLWEAQGFKSRHHLLQWIILYGIKAMQQGILKPERRTSRVVEVQKP